VQAFSIRTDVPAYLLPGAGIIR